MPRGRKKKGSIDLAPNIDPDTIKTILIITLFLLTGITLISFLFPTYLINSYVQKFIRGLFGNASILIPLILFSFTILLIDRIEWRIKEPRILFGLILFLFVLSSMFGQNGGAIGNAIYEGLKGTLSVYGAILVLFTGLVLCIFLIFNLSLEQVLDFISDYISPNLAFKFPSRGRVRAATEFKDAQNDADDFVFETKSFDPDAVTANSTSSYADDASVLVSDDVSTNFVDPVEEIKPSTFEIIPTMSEPQSTVSTKPSPAKERAVKVVPSMPVVKSEQKLDSLVTVATPALPYSDRVWQNPPLDLLTDLPENPDAKIDKTGRAKMIKEALKSFGINVDVVDTKVGPAVTQYSLDAEKGIKTARIIGLQNDLAMALASPTGTVRLEAPIPGKSLIGIEVPNLTRTAVSFKSLLASDVMKTNKSKIAIVLGKDVGGQTYVYDIGKMPHMLVAGATGSGKSVFLHSIIFSLLYRNSPQECKLVMIDPKRVEFTHYNDIPHLLTPVVTDIDKAAAAFKWAVAEMDRRYKLFESARVRDIGTYNEMSGFQALPYIVVIVDELAEIMVADPAAVEKSIIRLAQLARATGIHLVLAVQRPSTNIITGLIKANITCRVSFNVTSQIDSRVIIDQPGAEKLLGKGDMLFLPPDASKPMRLQAAFVSDKEISNLVTYLKAQGVGPDYATNIFDMVDKSVSKSVSAGGDDVDDLFDEAVDAVVSAGKGSASLLQRRLSVGYARAARLIDELEAKGVLGPANGSKPRDVLVDGVSSADMHRGDYPEENHKEEIDDVFL